MSSRAYTVEEIDDLRFACEQRWLFGTTKRTMGRISRAYKEQDKAKGVEELVRTAMLAGYIAKDLFEADGVKYERTDTV